MKRQLMKFTLVSVILSLLISPSLAQKKPVPTWPEITQLNKPWSRWWWEGSAVNQKDLTWMMEE
jgi:hypothetical protein